MCFLEKVGKRKWKQKGTDKYVVLRKSRGTQKCEKGKVNVVLLKKWKIIKSEKGTDKYGVFAKRRETQKVKKGRIDIALQKSNKTEKRKKGRT